MSDPVDWSAIRNGAVTGPPQLFGMNWGQNVPEIPTLNASEMSMPALDTSALTSLASLGSVAKTPSFLDGMLGSTVNGVTTQGWGGLALGAAQGIGNAWMGMKQYGLAKDQLAQSKKQFDLNFGAQQKTTNAALEDRQRARVASNPGAYQSVGDYMKKNGI